MKEKGKKFDGDKPRLGLVSPLLRLAAARALTYGTSNHEEHNWRLGIEWSRIYEALNRHVDAWWAGEEIDEDSGLHHLDCAAAELMFLIEYVYTGKYKEFDDRYIIDKKYYSKYIMKKDE